MIMVLRSPGKTARPYVDAGIREYAVRINRYARLELDFPDPGKKLKGLSEAEIRKAEALLLLRDVSGPDWVIALDEKGKTLSSVQFANSLNKWMGSGSRRILFLLGGAFGLNPSVGDRANEILSLSHLTFPHDLCRMIFLEQLYRAFTILHHEPYHHS